MTRTRLYTGEEVLGKETKHGPYPLHYANRTQAEKKAKVVNGYVIQRGRPFYVALMPR